MESRKIIVLAAVAAGLLAAAFWMGARRQPDSPELSSGPLLPEFQAQVNEVEGLRLKGAGGATLWEIRRANGNWTLATRGGYAADFGRVRELLLKLAAAKKVEPKTANPELYPRLGVQDVDAADAEGLLLEIDGTVDFGVVVGRATTKSDGNYVRLAGEAQSWQVDTALPIEREPAQWLDRELSQMPVSRVLRAEIEHGDGDRIELVRNAEAGSDFKLGNLPRGREPGSAYLADSAAAFFSDLRLDDVAQAAEAPRPEAAEQLIRARFDLDDGLVYRVFAWEREGKTLAQVEVELDEARAREAIAAAQARLREEYEARQAQADAPAEAETGAGEGEASASAEGPGAAAVDAADAPADAAASDAAEPAADAEVAPAPPAAVTDPEADAAQRLAALQAELETARARFGGWTFTLPSHKASNLTRKLAGYLAPEE